MQETLSNSFLMVPRESLRSNEESKSIEKLIILTNKINKFAKRRRMPKIRGRNLEIAIFSVLRRKEWAANCLGPLRVQIRRCWTRLMGLLWLDD